MNGSCRVDMGKIEWTWDGNGKVEKELRFRISISFQGHAGLVIGMVVVAVSSVAFVSLGVT